jgi:methylmalonyl-CoA/ethylmalonyl-CoA epimerase
LSRIGKMQTELAHIGVTVVDLDSAVNWYKDSFGAREVTRTYKQDFGLTIALLELGDSHLELLQPDKAQERARIEGTLKELLQRVGESHIAVSVPDIIGTYDRLKANGAEMVTDLIEERLFFCKDPNGILIEVKQKD